MSFQIERARNLRAFHFTDPSGGTTINEMKIAASHCLTPKTYGTRAAAQNRGVSLPQPPKLTDTGSNQHNLMGAWREFPIGNIGQ